MPARILFPAALAWFLFLISTIAVVRADEPTVGNLEQLVANQQWDDAIDVARALDESEDASRNITLSLARLARGLQQQERLAESAEFYQRSVASLSGSNLPAETVVLIRLAAASVLTQAKQWAVAIEALKPLLATTTATKQQRDVAVSILLKIGSGSLSKGAAAQASEAYSIALAHADMSQKPTAMLGVAWATAIMRDRPVEAAERLTEFLNQFPDHPDASRAARACIECYKQAGMTDQAKTLQDTLIVRWPDSQAALEVIRSHRNTAPDLVPRAVADWLMTKAKSDGIKQLDVTLTVLAMQIADRRQDLTSWAALAEHLANQDTKGQAISDALSQLDRSDPSSAERFATALIAPQSNRSVTPQARESAFRWAARNERWSMLAMASEQESPSTPSDSRTLTVERLMAEALVQVGRSVEALPWWNHVVDQRGANDFATLLRCAEAETAVGRDAALADRRINAARAAAGGDRFQLALVHLLDAELAIRKMDFDGARARLESVVRESDTDVALRGRAQWLIGETHYLQRAFVEAIEAYRRVESIDPDGIWVSAALVQAGKSFEQLGRNRDASVCYGHLISRFGNTHHAAMARRRMAALNGSNTENPSEIIRR